MPRKVFISYRRDDTAGYAGRIHDRLEREFGADLLFMDVDTIPLGANFTEVLRDGVAECEVLLALMGPNWLSIRDEEGNRRLDNPGDFLRIEIATALQRGIPIIPILLDGARMPKADQLPKELEGLAFHNGLDIRHASFRGDMDKLIRGLSNQPQIFVSPDKAMRAFVFPSDINRDDAPAWYQRESRYRGGAPAVNDLIAGHVKIASLGSTPLIPHYKAGMLWLLAQSTTARAPSLPEVPTFQEAGIRGLVLDQWLGVFVPKGTPSPIVASLNANINQALADPAVRESFLSQAQEPVGGTAEQFSQLFHGDYAKYERLLKELGIKTE